MNSGLSINSKRKNLVWGAGPHTSRRTVPLDLACFRNEDPSRNNLVSTAYFAKLSTQSLRTINHFRIQKSTITQKLRIVQKNLIYLKTTIRTLCIFWDEHHLVRTNDPKHLVKTLVKCEHNHYKSWQYLKTKSRT